MEQKDYMGLYQKIRPERPGIIRSQMYDLASPGWMSADDDGRERE